MIYMKKFLLLSLASFLLYSGSAGAGNYADPRLDAVASEVAGKPVQVWCETSIIDWVTIGAGNYSGFTFIGIPIVYIAPRQCETLHALLSRENIGSYYAASAILTLAHEAVHQRGVLNEGETDCLALPLVPTLAVKHFGIPATVTVNTVVRSLRLLRVKTKWVRVFDTKLVAKIVPNPFLALITRDALRWHKSKPAEYQGNC